MGIRLKLKARQRQRGKGYAVQICLSYLIQSFELSFFFHSHFLCHSTPSSQPTDRLMHKMNGILHCATPTERTLGDHNKAYHNITISVALSLVRVSSRCRQPGPARPASGPSRPIPRHLGTYKPPPRVHAQHCTSHPSKRNNPSSLDARSVTLASSCRGPSTFWALTSRAPPSLSLSPSYRHLISRPTLYRVLQCVSRCVALQRLSFFPSLPFVTPNPRYRYRCQVHVPGQLMRAKRSSFRYLDPPQTLQSTQPSTMSSKSLNQFNSFSIPSPTVDRLFVPRTYPRKH